MKKLMVMLAAMYLVISLAATCWAIDTKQMKQDDPKQFRQIVTVVVAK